MPVTTITEPWVYRPQTWDSPEFQLYLSRRTTPEVAGEELEVTLLHHGDQALERDTLQLKFGEEKFSLGQHNIPYSQIRCITTNTGELSPSIDTILLSCRDNGIKCFYIHEPDSVKAEMLLNKFRHLQCQSVQKTASSEVYTECLQNSQIFDYFAPKVVCRCTVDVRPVVSGEAVEKSFLVTLDEECLCLFSNHCQTSPDYQVKFHKDSGNDVVERMAVTHTTNTFNIETNLAHYIMRSSETAVEELITHMKRIKPKPRSCFSDLAKTCVHLYSLRPRPLPSTWQSEEVWQTPRVSTEPDTYLRDTDTAISESCRHFFRNFKDELETAYREGESNPDWQALWVFHDEGLRNVLALNLVAQRDARSGGLDPDNTEHFQSSLSMIDEQLFNQEFDGAVSSLRSMREVFGESSYKEVRPILEDDDYMLLRKLFFYFLKKQAS